MHQLLGISGTELTAEFCDAEAFLDGELKEVNDAIANADNFNSIIARAEEYMLKNLHELEWPRIPLIR